MKEYIIKGNNEYIDFRKSFPMPIDMIDNPIIELGEEIFKDYESIDKSKGIYSKVDFIYGKMSAIVIVSINTIEMDNTIRHNYNIEGIGSTNKQWYKDIIECLKILLGVTKDYDDNLNSIYYITFKSNDSNLIETFKEFGFIPKNDIYELLVD
jgi:hypothetical protein